MTPTEPARTPFFPVSLAKLVIMSVCTLGIYQLYWFYENWRCVKARTGERISPFWRTFFCFIFAFGLFARIRDADPRGARLPASMLAILWIALAIVATPMAVLPALPLQSAINAANAAAVPGHDPNAGLSTWNWLAIIVLGALFALMLYVESAGLADITM